MTMHVVDTHARHLRQRADAPQVLRFERARRLRAVCRTRGIALGAAALQFAMRHPAVTTVLVGARSAAEVGLDVGYAATPLDDDVFRALADIE